MRQLCKSPDTGKPTTHEQSGAFAPTQIAIWVLSGCALICPQMRAAWLTFLEFDRRYCDTIWGDVIGGACLVIIVCGLVVGLPLMLG